MNFEFECRESATKSLVESSIKFLAKELKLESSNYTTIVFFERGMAKREGIRGSVSQLGPKCLGMVLDPALDLERLILTVAHEMVHIKQYARGQVKEIPNRKSRYWMGKKVTKGYFEQPWEIEAFSKERVLANKLFQIINK